MTILEKGCQGGPRGYLYTTLGLGLRHTSLGRASQTQKLAWARLRPAGFRPADEDHWTGEGGTPFP